MQSPVQVVVIAGNEPYRADELYATAVLRHSAFNKSVAHNRSNPVRPSQQICLRCSRPPFPTYRSSPQEPHLPCCVPVLLISHR